jgi:hypothetical protein
MKKIKVRIGCYFCEEGVESESLAVDKDGNCIQSDSPKLTDDDNHFICKKCFEKVKTFFKMEEI